MNFGTPLSQAKRDIDPKRCTHETGENRIKFVYQKRNALILGFVVIQRNNTQLSSVSDTPRFVVRSLCPRWTRRETLGMTVGTMGEWDSARSFQPVFCGGFCIV